MTLGRNSNPEVLAQCQRFQVPIQLAFQIVTHTLGQELKHLERKMEKGRTSGSLLNTLKVNMLLLQGGMALGKPEWQPLWRRQPYWRHWLARMFLAAEATVSSMRLARVSGFLAWPIHSRMARLTEGGKASK